MELRIKDVIKEKKITVVALAGMIGITQPNMSNIVNGKSMPSLETLEKIANALSVPVIELFEKPSDGKIVGFVKVGDTVHEVKSVEDVKNLAGKL